MLPALASEVRAWPRFARRASWTGVRFQRAVSWASSSSSSTSSPTVGTTSARTCSAACPVRRGCGCRARDHRSSARCSSTPTWCGCAHDVQVVDEVLHPQTELSIADALRFRPDAKVGGHGVARPRGRPGGPRRHRGPRAWRVGLAGWRSAQRRLPRRVQRRHDQRRRGPPGGVADHRGRRDVSGRRTVPAAHRDHHRRVHARPLVARAVTQAVDRRGLGTAARWAHRRGLVPHGIDRPRRDLDVAALRFLRRRTRPGVRALAPRRHRAGHRGNRLRPRPELHPEPPTLAAGLARSASRRRHRHR